MSNVSQGYTDLNLTSNYTMVRGDLNKRINADCTNGSISISMPTMSSLEAGTNETLFIKTDNSVNTLSIFPINNPATTTINQSGGLSATATTLTVTSTTGFMSVGILLIDNELMTYQGLTSTTFTGLLRGYGDTIAAIHSNGATVIPENEMINGVESGIFLSNQYDFVVIGNRIQPPNSPYCDPNMFTYGGNMGSLLRGYAGVQTSNFTATTNILYPVNTSNNVISVELSGEVGDNIYDGKIIGIFDSGGNATNNPITITFNATPITNISVNNQAIFLIFNAELNMWIPIGLDSNWVLQQIENYNVSNRIWRGTWSTNNAFPSTGGSGTSGTIVAGDFWDITTTITINSNIILAPNTLRALATNPGQTASNWFIQSDEYNLYTTLTSSITSTTSTLNVVSTAGFPSSGVVYLDSEAIAYLNITSTTFTGLTRGYNNTIAAAHNNGAVLTSLGNIYINGNTATNIDIGTICSYAGAITLPGTLACDGTAYSRTTYSNLFNIIGTAYGAGDGSTTFNVPDLRGRFLRGVSGSTTNDPNTSTRTASATGGNTGNAVGSLQADAFRDHTHQVPAGNASAGTSSDRFARSSSGIDINFRSGLSTTTSSYGSAFLVGAETRPINVYVNFYIRFQNSNNPGLNTFLTSAMLATDTTANVASTIGFPQTSGTIFINNEAMTYTGTTATSFTGLTRGINGTTATAQPINSIITNIGGSGGGTNIPSLNTMLTATMTNTDTTATVTSTNGFPTRGAIYIDSEVTSYTNKTTTTFTGLIRGIHATTAATHNINAIVTPVTTSAYNSLLTMLSSAALSTDTTLTVTSTTGFASSGVLYIIDNTTNNESIAYTGITATTFTGLTRGYNNTTAASHAVGLFVTSSGLPYQSPGTGSSTTIGNIYAYSGATIPYGTFLCDGNTYSRTTYAGLFAVIGTGYGAGDGSTTFNVPDLRGRFLRGVTGSATNDPDATTRTASNSGGNTGNTVGSLQADVFASHTHTYNQGSALSTQAQSGSGSASNYGYTNTSTNTGATGGSETRPKNVYVNYIIVWNTPAGNGDVYLANNNAFTGSNTHSGTETFSGTEVFNSLTNASGTYTPLVVDSSNVVRTQPPSASISATVIAFQNTPPISPNVGDTYVVGTTPTDSWVGHNNTITQWDGSTWGFITPVTNQIITSVTGNGYQWNGATWVTYVITGNALTTQTTTTSTTVATWNTILYVNATGSSVVITLPTITAATVSTSITINRIDNNTQYSVIIVPNTGNTINGNNNNVFLYAQNNSLTFDSDGVSVARIVSQVSNNSITVNKSWLQSYVYNQTTGLTTGSVVLYNNNSATTGLQSYGSAIQQLSNGQFQLQAGYSYRLKATLGLVVFSTASSFLNFQWYNVTLSTYVGSAGAILASPAVYDNGVSQVAEAIITPTVNTIIEVLFYVGGGSNPTLIGDNSTGITNNRFGVAYIEQISIPANIINVVDTLFVTATSSLNVTTVGQVFNFPTILTGNMTWTNNNTATLIAGKTYKFSYFPLGTDSNIACNVQIYNITTSTAIPGSWIVQTGANYDTGQPIFYTPIQNCQVQIQVSYLGHTGYIGYAPLNAYMQLLIEQVGDTTVAGLPSTLGTQNQTLIVNPQINGYNYASPLLGGGSNVVSAGNAAGNTATTVHSYTIAANTLLNPGDCIYANYELEVTATSTYYISFAGINLNGGSVSLPAGSDFLQIRITMVTATTFNAVLTSIGTTSTTGISRVINQTFSSTVDNTLSAVLTGLTANLVLVRDSNWWLVPGTW